VRLANDYLRDALALQEAFLGRTFVAVEPGRAEVIGYYAMHNHFITGAETPAATAVPAGRGHSLTGWGHEGRIGVALGSTYGHRRVTAA
jgi:hypothetical protein